MSFSLTTNSSFEILSEVKIHQDADKSIDTIRLCQDNTTQDRFIKIMISDIEQLSDIENLKALPNYEETTLTCTEIYSDSIGFNFIIENGNGNIHKSKKFYFKS